MLFKVTTDDFLENTTLKGLLPEYKGVFAPQNPPLYSGGKLAWWPFAIESQMNSDKHG